MYRKSNSDLIENIFMLMMLGGTFFLLFWLGDKILGNPLQGTKIDEIVETDIENIRLDKELSVKIPYFGEFEHFKKNANFVTDGNFAHKYATKHNYDTVRYSVLKDLIEKDLLLDKGESSKEDEELYQQVIKNALLFEWSKVKNFEGNFTYDLTNLTIQPPQVALLDKTSKIELEGMFTARETGYTRTIHPKLFVGYLQIKEINKDNGTYNLLTISFLPMGLWETKDLENIISSFVPKSEQATFLTGKQFLQDTEHERTKITDLTKECVVNGSVSENCSERKLSSQETIDMYDHGLRKSVDVVESYFRFSPTISFVAEPKELLVGGVPIQVTYLVEKLPSENFTLEIIDKTYHMEKVNGNKTVPLTIEWN